MGELSSTEDGDTKQSDVGEEDAFTEEKEKACKGDFEKCDSSCTKVFKITQKAENQGEPCEYADGYKSACLPGEGECPVTCSYIAGGDVYSTPTYWRDASGSGNHAESKNICEEQPSVKTSA